MSDSREVPDPRNPLVSVSVVVSAVVSVVVLAFMLWAWSKGYDLRPNSTPGRVAPMENGYSDVQPR
ncbi:hypothetical protein ACFXHA_12750 [Nocardia sp. NPDC059240]|uniref:hypothetical protein n=1 Tax=Nocardia sp. NPDC059240 TaxID=3346786 RepID=UPI00368A26A5